MACCKCICECGNPAGECCGPIGEKTCCKGTPENVKYCCNEEACCDETDVCCDPPRCCPENTTCCGSEECCLASETCCEGVCCAEGEYCCDGVCQAEPCEEADCPCSERPGGTHSLAFVGENGQENCCPPDTTVVTEGGETFCECAAGDPRCTDTGTGWFMNAEPPDGYRDCGDFCVFFFESCPP